MPVNLCYTQKVRGFQQEYEKYFSKSIEIRLKRTKHHCSHCGSIAVTIEPQRRHKLSKMQKKWSRQQDLPHHSVRHHVG